MNNIQKTPEQLIDEAVESLKALLLPTEKQNANNIKTVFFMMNIF